MNIKATLESALQALQPEATLAVSDRADFQCNVAFALAKAQHANPAVLATEIANRWNAAHADLATATTAGGFINFTLTDQQLQSLAEFIVTKHKLPLPTQPQRTIFLDYGGANIAKELHIGHLRSPIIGEALKRVFQALGHKTVAGAYLGDWGLQMGLVIASLLEQKIPVEKVTMEMLGEIYPAASQRKKTDAEFYQRAADITAQMQNFVQPYYGMCQKLRELSLVQVRRNYEKLNCTFDLYDGESTYQPQVAPMLQALADQGLLQESNGAQIVNVATPADTQPMPPIVLKKQNGGNLYATSDVAALYTRAREYHPDQFVYLTDARQALHFEQVFRTARLAGFVPQRTLLTYVPYGTINGADGKPFKTRDGGTIKLEDILNIVANATSEFAVGLAAIKFADLINNVRKDYVFDLQKCLSFEGKTGPYLLYMVVRIKSILAKAGKFTPSFAHLTKYQTPQSRDILINIMKLAEAYPLAANILSLHPLAEALYHLANSFSLFYATQNILAEPDADKKQFLLSLALLTQTALELGLDTLAIDTVDKM